MKHATCPVIVGRVPRVLPERPGGWPYVHEIPSPCGRKPHVRIANFNSGLRRILPMHSSIWARL